MTVPTPPSDPLGVALHQTEAELAEKLKEACSPEPDELSDEPTGQIAKLSDSLLAAARAAKDVVSLRKRRRERKRLGDQAGMHGLREFVDSEGREWRVWPVTPRAARTGKRESSLGEFEQGWLAFETLDETLRRRLPHYPTDWMTMSEAKLQELLAAAVEAPARRTEIKPPEDDRRDPPA
ncbi:MAG: hypothetical protein ACT4PJ_16240 [Gemmatimonadaceae bacterium]